MIHPQTIVSLKKITGLNRISFNRNKGLTIGATALLGDVAGHRTIREIYPAIAKAAANTANVQIRNMGTLVGNLCNASPAADNAPTLLAMNAELNILGPKGEEFFPWKIFSLVPVLRRFSPQKSLHLFLCPHHLPDQELHTSICPQGDVSTALLPAQAFL